MSYDILFWKRRSDSPASPSFIYSLVSQDAQAPDLEPLDLGTLERALDGTFPDWRDPDGPFTCEFTKSVVSFSLGYSRVKDLVPALLDFGRTLGLTVFDPQADPVAPADMRRAEAIARETRRKQMGSERASDLSDLAARAERGDFRAQLKLGNKFADGDGVQTDVRRAVGLYRSAAEGGLSDAMFNLAACLQYGDGTEQDVLEAVRWYERASLQDRTYAPFALGVIHLGFGPVQRDNARAEACFREALKNGHPDAAASLELLSESEITIEMKRNAWKFCPPRE